MKKINFKYVGLIFGAVVLIVILAFISSRKFSVINNGDLKESADSINPITGQECANLEQRPYAVMLAGDAEARPLSGISQADLVIEMPVDPRPITRFMAVFQCNIPEEIGSIRSSREDFIPLALGFDAIYAHWGGERNALNQLNSGVADNIDALKYDGIYFIRKNTKPAPHNGFTGISLLNKAVDKFKYSKTGGFKYSSEDRDLNRTISNIVETISLDYLFPVKWVYDSKSEEYLRYRNESPEIDSNNGKQVSVSNVVVMETEARWIGDQYITVNVVGEGKATFYQQGISISGQWLKEKDESPLTFKTSNGEEYKFKPGKIWIQIKAPIL